MGGGGPRGRPEGPLALLLIATHGTTPACTTAIALLLVSLLTIVLFAIAGAAGDRHYK